MISPDKEHTDGYVRVCQNCGGDMPWIWGLYNSYFKCDLCGRIEPCGVIVIEGGTVTLKEGNKETPVGHFKPEEMDEVIRKCLE